MDEVEWHERPGDKKFNNSIVIMRDRREKADPGKTYIRLRLPSLQGLIGNCLGYNWNPRKGDLVYVLFYQERKGIILGSGWNWGQVPPCRPSPYDIVCKGGQWLEPKQDNWGDFYNDYYPEAKKPFCFRWWHGPVLGHTGPGRDWCFLFDYCRMGDAVPDCRNCKTIDSICRDLNHYIKVYSSETESRKAYPLRGEYHNPSGSYWLFEGCDKPSNDYTSEVHTEGKGYWRIQGATDETHLKGHLQHSPNGNMDIHSETSDPSDNTGARVKVFSHADSGDIAAEVQWFDTGSYIRIMKSGEIILHSPSKITLDAPLIDALTNLVHDHGAMQIDAVCSHAACSCLGAQDLSSYTKSDPNNKLTVSPSQASCAGLTCNESAYICKDFSEDYFQNNRIVFDVNVSACSGGGCGCCGMSNNNAADVLEALGYKLVCEAIDDSGLKLKLLLLNGQTVVASDATPISTGTQYYCALKKAKGENAASLDVYTDQNMTQKLDTLSISDANIPSSCRYLYGLSSLNSGQADKTISCSIGNVNVSSH